MMRCDRFIRKVGRRKPILREYFRRGYFTDGKELIWEYPRLKPDGEQMDFVESMELNDAGHSPGIAKNLPARRIELSKHPIRPIRVHT
jgi:hypothetical protein